MVLSHSLRTGDVVPPDLITERVKIRAVWEVAIDRPRDSWREENTHRQMVELWKQTATKFEDKLDLVIVPAAKGTTWPTKQELEAATENALIANELRDALDHVCVELAPKPKGTKQ